jgi:hypothetical protein
MRESRFFIGFGGRELMVAAGALGLVFGLGFAGEAQICAAFDSTLESERAAALDRYVESRCEPGQLEHQCQSVEVIGSQGCRAKIRVVERRFDAYGEEIGLFRLDEGLTFSPTLARWRKREALDDKQLLGFVGENGW